MDFALFAWLATLADVLLASVILLRPLAGRADCRPVRIGVGSAVAAPLSVAGLNVLKLPVAVALGTNIFGLIRLAYMGCVVTLPLVGLIALVAGRGTKRRATPAVRLLACVALLAAPVGVFATLVEPFRTKLETATVSVPPGRAGREPIKVGVLADIQSDHIGPHEIAAVELLMQQSPDVILMPGDMWQGYSPDSELPGFRELLRRLKVPGGAYFVAGHTERFYDVQKVLEGTPVQLLRNEIVRLDVRDRAVTIGGLTLEDSDRQQQVLREMEAGGDEDVRILLAHVPDNVWRLPPNSRIDLLVAGHTHGGQVVLPFLGPLMTCSDLPPEIAMGGLHEMDGRRLYVSRGLGSERGQAPRLRFLCPPEVTVVTIGGEDTE